MNRGNLAEDPRVDRPSSSRYSRYGTEDNALLYVSDREWKKALASRRVPSKGAPGDQAPSGTAGVDRSLLSHAAGRNETDRERQSVSAKTSGFSKLEVGMHGRLFGVQEGMSAGEHTEKKPEALSARNHTESDQDKDRRIESAAHTFASKKMTRPYLDAQNPLLEKKNIRAAHAAASYVPAAPATPATPAAVQTVLPKNETRLSMRKLLLASGLGVLTAGYIAAGVHFSDHFYPATEFFGISASGKTVSEVKKLVENKVDGYRLEIVGRSSSGTTQGMRDEITADDVSLRYQDNGMIDEAMRKQYSAIWPVMALKELFTKNEEKLGTEYDASRVDPVLKNLSVFDESRVTAPKNAALQFSKDGAYISKEVMGTTLDYSKTREAVVQALNDGTTYIDLDKENLYKNPTVYSDDDALNEKADTLNKVLGADVTLDLGDQSIELDPETVSKTFLSLDMDGNYYIDSDKISAYTEKLADTTDTVGRGRTFETSLGTQVQLDGGDYGWTLDADSTADELKTALEGKQKGGLEPVYFTTALCRDKNDIGDSYVEINLTNQHMWFYKDGSLVVDTPVVTGNPQKNNETPYGGVWSLKGKYRNATLKGQGYATPVDYWMPFNGGVGIHDLQSRYYFGGTVYNGAGSHGCINTPLAAVRLIYHYIEDGTPVVVYKDESQEAVAQNTGMQDIQSITAYIEATYGTVSNDDTETDSDSGSGQTFETDQSSSAVSTGQSTASGNAAGQTAEVQR